MYSYEKWLKYALNPVPLYQFNWIAAAIGAAASVYGALKSGGESKGEKQQIRIAKYQFKRFKEFYAPIEERLAETAAAGPDIPGALGRASTDVAVSFDKARDIEARRMGRYGIDPSMGRGRGIEREFTQKRAMAEVSARNLAREQEEDKSWARQLTFLQTGKGLPAQASAGYGAAAAQAQQTAENAAAGFGAAGYWGQKAISQYNQQPLSPNAMPGARAGGASGAIPSSVNDSPSFED